MVMIVLLVIGRIFDWINLVIGVVVIIVFVDGVVEV